MDWSLLNSEQTAAAKHTKGAVMVSAGAGSGKTRLLTHRIAHIVEEGVSPYNILAITFTNKAAAVMKERIQALIGDVKYMWVMTFHAMCARILRMDIERLGYNSNFTIYGETEKERVLKQLLQDKSIDKDKWLKPLKDLVSGIKSTGGDADDFFDGYHDKDNTEILRELYHEYNKTLKSFNALDFDDLLLVTYQLLSTQPDIKAKYQERFLYVSVDEFQDTNNIQFNLICQLVPKDGNIFAVGDENQSIYGWRHANTGNIKHFTDHFNATSYKLEQNYRSSQKILDAANKLIGYNDSASDKKLWTENKGGVKIERFSAYDERGEAEYVAECIKALNTYNDINYGDVAVLLRVNALTRSLEEAFLSYGIPYKVFGGMKFYERKEIKDIIAYLRLVSNPRDNEALSRIINVPRRGIGAATLSALTEAADSNDISAMDALSNADKYLANSAGLKKLQDFYNVVSGIKQYADNHSIVDTVEYVLEKTNMRTAYNTKTEEDFNRLLNIEEFIGTVNEYYQNNSDPSLEGFLQSVSLISDIDEMDENGGYVNLATVHSAKGMEFDVVFICGLEEGLFPIGRAKDSKDDMEEERRLMYVAITRAGQRLYMTSANSRFMYGRRSYNPKSRFLAESDVDHEAQKINAFIKDGVTSSSVSGVGAAPARIKKNTDIDPRLQQVGTAVNHKIFGQGVIIQVDNADNNIMVKVNFLSVGTKNLILTFAPLEVIG